MKSCLLKTLIVAITVAYVLSLGRLPASAEDKAKYGGILKFNHSKEADIIGNPVM